MHRIPTLSVFVIFAVGVAVAAGPGNNTASSDVSIYSFTLTSSDGKNGDLFGSAVAIDSNTAVVGASGALNGKGAAYVFVKPPSGWSNMVETAELTSSDGESGDNFGSSVAISGDTIVIGASQATINGNKGQGSAYVFVKPPGGWRSTTQTAKLTGSDGTAEAHFGNASAMDGNTIVVGAYAFQSAQGAAYVFVKPAGGWSDMTETAELTASDERNGNDFGGSVAVNGETVVVGAYQDSCSCYTGPGAAYVFVQPSNGWTNMTETAKLRASDGMVGDVFGGSVSISSNTIAVGASEHFAGRAYVFVEPIGGWVNMTQTAELKNNVSGSCFGNSISIYGSELLVGAQCAKNFNGAAFLFLKPSTGWRNSDAYNVVLAIHFTFPRDNFASSVAIQGKTAIIGAPYAPTIPPCCTDGPGQAFIFTAQ